MLPVSVDEKIYKEHGPISEENAHGLYSVLASIHRQIATVTITQAGLSDQTMQAQRSVLSYLKLTALESFIWLKLENLDLSLLGALHDIFHKLRYQAISSDAT